MAFEFPLATVLRLQESLERQEELALEKILVKIAEVQRRIDTLAADIARAHQRLEQELQQALSACEVDAMTTQIENALRHRRELVASLPELHRQREAQARKYQSAHQRRRTLSDMQDRQREAYLHERDRVEQRFVDDVFASRAQRS